MNIKTIKKIQKAGVNCSVVIMNVADYVHNVGETLYWQVNKVVRKLKVKRIQQVQEQIAEQNKKIKEMQNEIHDLFIV